MSDQSDFQRLFNVLAVLPAVALAACDPMSANRLSPRGRSSSQTLIMSRKSASRLRRNDPATDRERSGLRVAGKVAKRLAEVGTLVELANRSRYSMKSIFHCRPSRPPQALGGEWRHGAGNRRRNARQRAAAKRLVDRRATRPGQSHRR